MDNVPGGMILPHIAVDRASAKPLYRQIYEGYREAIVERRLRGGQRLPSTRQLAAELRISRIPVLNAFEQLQAEGYFESRIGAGTFVASALPDDLETPRHGTAPRDGAPAADADAAGRAGTDLGAQSGPRPTGRHAEELAARARPPWHGVQGAFRISQPAIDHFPFHVWSGLVARHGRNPGHRQFSYGGPLGQLAFREAVAAYLRTARAVRCTADQIVVVSGSQQALDLAARVLLDPGSAVWVEEPGYGGAHDALALAGARLVPVPVDEEGLNVAAGIAAEPRARAAYVTPSHQYPLGMTMTAARRLQLLDWARQSGGWILEDDYDSEYRYESFPVAALQGLDRDARVIYIGTFSKVMFPALRLGYLVVPADLVARFVAVREAMDIFPPPLLQTVVADFINEGHFARHLRRMRQLYRQRRDCLAQSLRDELGEALEVGAGQAGMHLVATLAGGRRDHPISLRAARQRLSVLPLSSCYLGEPRRQGLVLGYAASGPAEIRDGVRRLREVMADGGDDGDHRDGEADGAGKPA
jgi:GntR family transcriptional regulator/MocR family aminotransferase